tara:strand:- start:25 stop:477 length:453 start_codon:yes stop_codon:yes gene_type:complete
MNPLTYLYITAIAWLLAGLKLKLTAIETIAAFFATWTFIKMILLKQNWSGYLNWATKFFKSNNNMKFLRFSFLLIFAAIAYKLIPEIGIVSFFAAIFAGVSLYAHLLLHYPKLMRVYVQEFKGKNAMSQIAFDWLIWIVLGGWALYEIII